MSNENLEYLTDAEGNPRAVVIPIEIWRKLLPQESSSLAMLPNNLEDYCLSKAMDAATDTPLLSRDEALRFLNEGDSD